MKKRVCKFVSIFVVGLSLFGCSNNQEESFQSDNEKEVLVESISLEKGTYIGGEDLDVGQYVISFEKGNEGGLVSVYKTNIDLDNTLLEFIDSEEDVSYFISLSENEYLEIPCSCKLFSVDYTDLKVNETRNIYPGIYTCGKDIQEGKYIITFDGDNSENGIIYLYKDNIDDYKYNSSIEEKEKRVFYISFEEGMKLDIPVNGIIMKEEIIFEDGLANLYAGYYLVGKDIPEGKYNIHCTPDENVSGFILVLPKDGQLDVNEKLFSYIKDEDESFYVSLEEGDEVCLPCKSVLEQKNELSKNASESKE